MFIRHVLFDLGNVLLPFDPQRLVRSLKPVCDASEDEILASIWRNPMCEQFEKGLLSPEEFFNELSTNWKLNLDMAKFTERFNDIFEEDTRVTGLLPEIKNQGRTLGLISNINPIHWAYIWKKYPFVRQLDFLSLSHEIGSRKPEEKIYRHALESAGCAPEEVFYVDDVPQFVSQGQKLNIHATVFKGPEPLRQDLISRQILKP